MTTETKLELCPVCGERTVIVQPNVVCGRIYSDPPQYHYSAPVEVHETLARRAEIGKTLERILAVNPGSLRVFGFEQWLTNENALDALRALAAKLRVTI